MTPVAQAGEFGNTTENMGDLLTGMSISQDEIEKALAGGGLQAVQEQDSEDDYTTPPSTAGSRRTGRSGSKQGLRLPFDLGERGFKSTGQAIIRSGSASSRSLRRPLSGRRASRDSLVDGGAAVHPDVSPVTKPSSATGDRSTSPPPPPPPGASSRPGSRAARPASGGSSAQALASSLAELPQEPPPGTSSRKVSQSHKAKHIVVSYLPSD